MSPVLETWAKAAFASGLTLHEAAALDPAAVPMHGRGTVYLVDAEGARFVVRRYLRGGGMRFLGDRYLRTGTPRPRQEAMASFEAARRGIRVARVLAWSVYPAGLYYRGDLVTDFVPATITLGALLFKQEPWSDQRAAGLRSSGTLIARMASAGLQHADLNANNILLQRVAHGYEPVALDLDRMTVSKEENAIDPQPMLDRLERSLRKLERAAVVKLSGEEWEILRTHAGTTR